MNKSQGTKRNQSPDSELSKKAKPATMMETIIYQTKANTQNKQAAFLPLA